jgi:uncharacterized protein YjiS (DUF1127 family)
MDSITLFLSAIIAILALVLGLVIFYWLQMSRKIDELLEKGNIKDLKDIFLKQKDVDTALEKRLEQAYLRLEHLEDVSTRTIQKTAVVRFDPFNEMAGKQSFVIAFLDNRNNGFVISSLFVKDGNRVYAKAVKDGKSDILLSKEETHALEKAMKS